MSDDAQVKPQTAEERAIVQRNLKRFKFAAQAYEEQRKREQEDLSFQIPEKQWPEDVQRARGRTSIGGVPIPARPMLSVAPVDEPIQLVSNLERSANLSAVFKPQSEDADDQTAQILQALYDQNANHSNASTARSWAYERVLWCGTGWYRLDKVYDPDGGDPSDQKIIWRRIKYQGNIYADPFAEESDKCDARWLIEVRDMPVSEHQARWPDAQLSRATDSELISTGSEVMEWMGAIENQQGETGAFVVEKAWGRWIKDSQGAADTIRVAYVWDREGGDLYASNSSKAKVTCTVQNCAEVLETYDWDGSYIPYVPVIGRELQPFDGKERTIGMIANAKDSARLVNYAASGAVEMAALEPRAPFALDPRQIKSYEEFWKQSNTRNFPYLPYRFDIDGQPVPPPQRVQVDVARLGPNMQILSIGGSMLQASMSTFDPALGKQPTAHRSGRALEALQGQTQEANSHYLDNLATISIPLEAKIWLDLAPHVYDREGRIVRILKGDKSELVMLHKPFMVNPKTGIPQPAVLMDNNALFYDLKGSYNVSVTVGKSKASRLQEGTDAMTAILQAEPALMTVIGPEWARFQDYPGSLEVATLLKKNRDHQMPWLSDNPQGSPELQLQQAQQQLQALTQAAQKMKQDLDTDAVKAQRDVQIAQAEFQMKIQLEAMKLEHERLLQAMKDATQIEGDRIMAAKEGIIAEREIAEERVATGLKIVADAAKHDMSIRHEATQAELDRRHETRTLGLQHGADAAASAQAHEQTLAQTDQQQQFDAAQADADRKAAETAQPAQVGGNQ